jgi:hypothetical protein
MASNRSPLSGTADKIRSRRRRRERERERGKEGGREDLFIMPLLYTWGVLKSPVRTLGHPLTTRLSYSYSCVFHFIWSLRKHGAGIECKLWALRSKLRPSLLVNRFRDEQTAGENTWHFTRESRIAWRILRTNRPMEKMSVILLRFSVI